MTITAVLVCTIVGAMVGATIGFFCGAVVTMAKATPRIKPAPTAIKWTIWPNGGRRKITAMTSKSLTEILRSQSSPPSRTDGRLTKAYSGRRDRSGGTIVRIVEHGDARQPHYRTGSISPITPPASNGGYGGSGPSQLALAILADALDHDNLALKLLQQFQVARDRASCRAIPAVANQSAARA